ncbi:MAG: DUF2244 domain-containing protein [Acidocella sp.]|nr:DUF2244 domain-containing protein [Acidocella sp.]
MDSIANSPEPPRLLFEAVVSPHRSLSRRALKTVFGLMVCASLMVTLLMFILGAWPVIGFNGADIALAGFLLWLNMRAARAREVISLSEAALDVTRTDVNGRRVSFSLPAYWLKVVLHERPGTVPKLLLTARGTSVELAHQLGEAPKRDLAAALTAALHRARHPRFDNPQLR